MENSASESPTPQQEWFPRSNPWIIAVAVMIPTFMEVLDTSVANVSLPHIAGNLSATPEESTWVLTSYLVSNAIILPATAWLGSFFGRKRFLMVCIGIFTAASALCGAAANLGMLVVARVLQGAGGGALQPISQAVLLESFPPALRGAAMAVFAMGVVVAPIIGPTLGGWITDNYSWRWVFYINLPIGVLAVLMAHLVIEDPPYLKRKKAGMNIDYIGFGLMAVGLGALQIVLDKGQEADWFEALWLRWFVLISASSLIAFLFWELRHKEPIVNLRTFLDRNFAVGTALIAILGVVIYGANALLPLFLQNLMGYPALRSGLAVSPRGIGAVIATVVMGRMVRSVDNRLLIASGFAVLSVSTFMLGNINLEIGIFNVIWPLVINGMAVAFIFVPLTTATVGTLANEQMGNATGIFNLMRNIGGSFGIAVVTTMLSRGAQTHQALLLSRLTPYDPAYREWLSRVQPLLAQGSPMAAAKQAVALLYGALGKQAALWAYVDNFRLLSVLSVLCVIPAFFFRKVRVRGAAAALH